MLQSSSTRPSRWRSSIKAADDGRLLRWVGSRRALEIQHARFELSTFQAPLLDTGSLRRARRATHPVESGANELPNLNKTRACVRVYADRGRRRLRASAFGRAPQGFAG
jgi:hypothetical protein